MLRLTTTSLGRARGYENRVMYYAYRRQKIRYLPPKLAHAKSPLANKQPEEFGETWNQRTGPEWMYRMRNRNEYRHWPWVTWQDDPLGTGPHALAGIASRSFSAKHSPASTGGARVMSDAASRRTAQLYPLVGQDYRVPSHYPVSCMAPFIHMYCNKQWSRDEIVQELEKIEAKGWKTIEDVAKHFNDVVAWNNRFHRVPTSLLVHLRPLAKDILKLNQKKKFRCEMQEKGYLRTNELQRYFALPYLRTGPAMPTTLKQPSGQYPAGAYSEMNGNTVRFHPAYRIDDTHGEAFYPQ